MSQTLLHTAILTARASLAVVLIAAGAAKLADTSSFAATLVGLGIPSRRRYLVQNLARAIPITELALGFALIGGLWSVGIDITVLILTCGFSVVTINAIVRKSSVTCRCFGALGDAQFGVVGLVRSLVLSVLAASVVWGDTMNPDRISPHGSLESTMLLLGGYLLFGLAAAQAANTLSKVKERIGS